MSTQLRNLSVTEPMPRNNYTATTNPGSSDSAQLGYNFGSRWLNQTSKQMFTCVDPTNGVAIWKAITSADSSGGTGGSGSGALYYRGIVAAGGEFGVTRPPATTSDYSNNNPKHSAAMWHPQESYNYIASRQKNAMIVIPFTWERLQQSFYGPLHGAYLENIRTQIRRVANAGLKPIPGVWDKGAYWLFDGSQGVRRKTGGPAVPVAAFADMWGKLAAAMKDEPVFAWRVNEEPVGPEAKWFGGGDSALTWQGVEAYTQAASNAIRNTGWTGPIMTKPTAFYGNMYRLRTLNWSPGTPDHPNGPWLTNPSGTSGVYIYSFSNFFADLVKNSGWSYYNATIGQCETVREWHLKKPTGAIISPGIGWSRSATSGEGTSGDVEADFYWGEELLKYFNLHGWWATSWAVYPGQNDYYMAQYTAPSGSVLNTRTRQGEVWERYQTKLSTTTDSGGTTTTKTIYPGQVSPSETMP